MKKSLFCYGTLRSPRVIQSVTGRVYVGRQALLRDFAIFQVRNAEYPGIIPCRGSTVEGTLYRDIDANTLRILDKFEGSEYFRDRVRVSLADGGEEDAFVYVVRPQKRGILTGKPWDYERFLESGIDRFMRRFVTGRRGHYRG